MLRLALDQNFPLSVLDQVGQFLPSSLELTSLQRIDHRLTTLDDRPLIIALTQLGWNGLITNNYKMLYEPHEVAAVIETKAVVVQFKASDTTRCAPRARCYLSCPGSSVVCSQTSPACFSCTTTGDRPNVRGTT